MTNLSFIVNTAKNEKEYIKLLFYSMEKNFSHRNHEIIVFVDSDNQDTVGFLQTQKSIFPNLRILKNPLPIPMGYQLNINLMFEAATNDIVSYLQSDMVVSPNYDVNILRHLDDKTVLAATRIEPPLHPPGPEKIVKDFGTDPATFMTHFEEFCNFADDNRIPEKITNYYFAPFTCHKNIWTSIGGHDTLFRRSREDSDVLWRLILSGAQIKQTWNALVYHFTCTSSRGIKWWQNSEESNQRLQMQQAADIIELRKFTRKWGGFAHPTTPEEAQKGKYQIAADIKGCNLNMVGVLIDMFCLFDKIYIDDKSTFEKVKEIFPHIYDPANYLLNVSPDQWTLYKKIFRTIEFDDIYSDGTLVDKNSNDVIVSFDINTAVKDKQFFDTLVKLNDIIGVSFDDEFEPGNYDVLGVKVKMNVFRNRIKDNIYVENPGLKDIQLIEI